MDHREQVLRQKQQTVEERLQSLCTANHRLKEAETLLKGFDETERALNAKFEDLRIREERLVADRALLDHQIQELNQKLADPDSQAGKIIKEEMQIKGEKERLLAEEEELSRKNLQLEERQRTLQNFGNDLNALKEELSLEEKRLKEVLQEAESKKSLSEEEATRVLLASKENEEHGREINEKAHQIEEREKEVSLKEKSSEEASANLEAKRSELAAQEQTISERLNQIEEQVQKRAIDILKIAQSIARGDKDNDR
jgi:chromosome segregation ATPase